MNIPSKYKTLSLIIGGALLGGIFSIVLSSHQPQNLNDVVAAEAASKNAPCSSENLVFDSELNKCIPLNAIQNNVVHSISGFDNVEVRIASVVNGLIPNINLQAQDISYIETADLYAFMIGGKIFYTTENAKSLIAGDVLDVEMLKTKPEKANITTEFKRIYNGGVSETDTKADYKIASLDRTKTLNIGSDDAKQKVAIMFDISCPKSKDLYPKLIEITAKNKNVQFNLMLISRTASASVEKKSKEIFCAYDNRKSLDFYIKTSIQDQSQQQVQGCKFNPDYPAIHLGDNFSGTTPVFYDDKNRVLVGNKPIELIEEYLSGY